jgi:hypothetical protein
MKPWAATRFLALVSGLALSGCASAWSEYDDSLYETLETPGPETYEAHSEILRRVIEESESGTRKPPPGVYAEYGYYLSRLGRAGEAKKYFRAEAGAYPESAVFCQILERMAQGKKALPPEDGGASGGNKPSLRKDRGPKEERGPAPGPRKTGDDNDGRAAEVPGDAR